MIKKKVLLTGKKSNLKNYINAIERAGMLPVFESESECDALILTGGGDISPCFYGKMYPSITEIDLDRDCLEFYLIRKYLNERKKILGICRGLQILNVYFGGTLAENVSSLETHSRQNQKNDKKHLNKSVNGSFCNKLYGEAFTSNSAHHQAIETIGKGLKPSAYSIDGVIEAIEGKNIIAVQFHPERMNDEFTSDGAKFFDYFSKLIH